MDNTRKGKAKRTVNWLMMMVILSLIIAGIGFYLYISGRDSRGPRGRFVKLGDIPMKSL